MSKVEEGSTVTVHYIGKTDDGNEFDNSYKRNQPLSFKVGENQMIPGFESAVLGREMEEKFEVKIPKDQAYGDYSSERLQEIPKAQLGLPEESLVEGNQLQAKTETGQTYLCVLKEVKEETAVLDLNHPLAGEDLNFSIEIVGVE